MAGWFLFGDLYFCEGRFASFAVVGPFSNGPYGAAVLVFVDGAWGRRWFCGKVVWMGMCFWHRLPGHPPRAGETLAFCKGPQRERGRLWG